MTGEDPHALSVEFYGAVPSCGGPEGEVTPTIQCNEHEAVQDPLWRSAPINDTAYGPWMRVSDYTCTQDPIHAAAINAWR
ncbi:hypothetical protein, partial [Demequina globuliformis]|uniref:hypothetical protein n=1 Tax=Demequina globuliformis TaxID=676202 RepID=UPI001F2E3509